MKLKKILSIVLSAVLILGTVSGLVYGEEAEETIYGRESAGIVNVLGIAEFTEEQLSENITRAEFLKMLAIASGYGEMKSEEVLFSDLPIDHEYEPYIKALVKLGAVKGDNQGKIYPDGEIGLLEAVSVAVKLTGYGIMAEAKGGYPNGYWNIAKSNNILKGLPASQYTVLTKGMAAKLVENTLKADLMVQTGFGNETTFEERKGTNFLWEVFETIYLEGIVEGVDISRIAGVNDVTPFWIDIDGFEIEAKDVETPRQYLGYKVDAYYTHKRADYPKLIWIEKSRDNVEYTFAAEDIASISGQRIKIYTEKGKQISYRFKKGIPVIYNGTSTAQSFSMALLSGKYGTVRLVDNSDDKSIDVAILEIFDNYVVSQVDAKNYVIYDEYNFSKKITLDTNKNDPYVVIYNPESEEISVNEIEPGSVLSVFESAPDSYQKFIRAYVMNNTLEGTISKIKDNGKTVVIGDVEYKLTDVCKTNCSRYIKVGQPVKLYLDFAGNVACIKESEGTQLAYGYLIATDSVEGLNSQLRLKIFTMNEETVILDTADRIELDGNIFKNSSALVLSKLKAASKAMFAGADETCVAQVLRYGIDSDGKVNVIDTLLDRDGAVATRETESSVNDSLFSEYSSDTVYYKSSYKRLGPKIAVATNTQILQYPSPLTGDVNDDNKYKVELATSLLVDTYAYAPRAFYCDADEYFAELLGFEDSSDLSYSVTAGTSFSIVDEFTQVYDEKTDEVRDCLVLLTKSGPQQLYIEEGFTIEGVNNEAAGLYEEMTVDQLRKGDVVRYSSDKDGFIKALIFVLRTESDTWVTTGNLTTNFVDARTIRKGLVYDKFEEGFVVYYPDGDDIAAGLLESKDLSSISADKLYSNTEFVIDAGATTGYFVYEEGRAGEYGGRITDMGSIKSYKDTGTDCSRILIQTYYGQPRGILIY